MMTQPTATHYTTCPLCEATCGLEVQTAGREIVSIRGDRDDVFSQGYICPKAAALKELDADPDRLRAPMIRAGKQWRSVSWDEALAVVDRRRTRTAEEADEHLFIQPGTDAFFLFALAHTLFAEGLVQPGRLGEHLNGLDEVERLARAFAPEVVAPVCRIAPDAIRRIARELAAAESAAVYGRIGTCTQEFGTLASWLVDVLNVLTGNLDRAGGALFPRAAAGARNTEGTPGRGAGVRLGLRHSRVRGLPAVYGELPVVALAEEILTPGDGQIRALVTIAGNPVLSTPHSGQLAQALGQLDFMLSVDVYLNQTTRPAHVILPPPSPLERGHYDLAFYQLSVRNIARYSPAIFSAAAGHPQEWEILLRLAGIVSGQGAVADPVALDDVMAQQLIRRETKREGSRVAGRDPAELLAALAPRRGPERLLDFMLRTGPYGDGFAGGPGGRSEEHTSELQSH